MFHMGYLILKLFLVNILISNRMKLNKKHISVKKNIKFNRKNIVLRKKFNLPILSTSGGESKAI